MITWPFTRMNNPFYKIIICLLFAIILIYLTRKQVIRIIGKLEALDVLSQTFKQLLIICISSAWCIFSRRVEVYFFKIKIKRRCLTFMV